MTPKKIQFKSDVDLGMAGSASKCDGLTTADATPAKCIVLVSDG